MDLSAFSGWLTAYRSPSTRAGYLWEVAAFTAWAEGLGIESPGQITKQLCISYLAERRLAGVGGNALRRCVWALRCWLDVEIGPGHPVEDLEPPKAPRRRQRVLSWDSLSAVLASCDTSTAQGVRDLAMLALMVDTGLRSSEVCRLRLDDVDLPGLRLVVQIKGGDDGAGVFSPHAGQYLARWLEVREGLAHCRTVFCSIYHGKPLTTGGLRAIFRRIARDAGLPALSPHDLRRTMATLATLAGAPSRVTQVGGRWGSIKQVETYTASLAAEAFRQYSPVARAMGGRPGVDPG